MKKQIQHVSVMQCGKIIAGIYFAISIPLLALMLVFSGFNGEAGRFGIGGALALIVVYPVVGFISGVAGAWLYNIVAARIGGFEYTTVDV